MINVALTKDISLVPFIFPGYRMLTRGLVHRAKRGMYYLKAHERASDAVDYFTAWADDAVVVSTVPLYGADFDLREREVCVTVLSDIRKIRMSKRVLKKAESMTDYDFSQFIRNSSLLKKWILPEKDLSTPSYELFHALAESKVEFLNTYYRVREGTPAPVLLSSIVTFLDRVSSTDHEDASEFYAKILRANSNMRGRMTGAVSKLAAMPPSVPIDWKIIHFCLWLRGMDSL